MTDLSALERAVLRAIAAQVPKHAAAFEHQINHASVLALENTGAGFFTTFNVASNQLFEGLPSPVGDVAASVQGLKHGMGFLLWLKNGLIYQLEGYNNGYEDTSVLDFASVEFHDVEAR
jgi:hypothetical protein